jgi:hypothetical protein
MRLTKHGCSFVVGFNAPENLERVHCVSRWPSVASSLRTVTTGSQVLIAGTLRLKPRTRIAVDEALLLRLPSEGSSRRAPDHEVAVPAHDRVLADGRVIRVAPHVRYKAKGAKRVRTSAAPGT